MKLHATLDLINFLEKMAAENVAFNLATWYGFYDSRYLTAYKGKNLHVCGTSACIAGLIAADKEMSDKFGILPSHDCRGKLQGVKTDTRGGRSVTTTFAETLGISFSVAELLLGTCNKKAAEDFYCDFTQEDRDIEDITIRQVILVLYILLNKNHMLGELSYAE